MIIIHPSKFLLQVFRFLFCVFQVFLPISHFFRVTILHFLLNLQLIPFDDVCLDVKVLVQLQLQSPLIIGQHLLLLVSQFQLRFQFFVGVVRQLPFDISIGQLFSQLSVLGHQLFVPNVIVVLDIQLFKDLIKGLNLTLFFFQILKIELTVLVISLLFNFFYQFLFIGCLFLFIVLHADFFPLLEPLVQFHLGQNSLFLFPLELVLQLDNNIAIDFALVFVLYFEVIESFFEIFLQIGETHNFACRDSFFLLFIIYNLNEFLLHLLEFPGRVYSMIHNRPRILVEYAEHPLLILILL